MRASFQKEAIGLVVALTCLWGVGFASSIRAQESDNGEHEDLVREDSSDREQKILALVKDRDPEVEVDEVDMERLRVRRIDVVDENNVIRMTIAGVLPDPVVDGIQYRRSTPVSGIMVRDARGNERGGFGFNLSLDGPMIALDHSTGEGAGFAVRGDGTAMAFLGAEKEPVRSEELDGALLPGGTGQPKSSLVTKVGSDGRPSLALTDEKGRTRVRITLTDEGRGAIEFVDAEGNVVETVVPERERQQAP
ncbi:MAG: hypothetical protein R3234_13915 [Thermoanaerobaculia bacterium]|nr:hypothetical protein [Thermoanaerobaculia bacterium]